MRRNPVLDELGAYLIGDLQALARETQEGKEIRVRSKVGVRVARGAVMSVDLAIRGLEVEDPEETMIWDGEITNASFPVTVPREAAVGTYPGAAVIRVDRVLLTKIHFVVRVGGQESRQPQQTAPARRYRTAFASYASQDRDDVLARR